jgi:hypothetical protein
MDNAGGGDALYEFGEAIGNVGRRLLRRRSKRGEAEQALRRWLKIVPAPVIPPTRPAQRRAEGEVIDVTWRVVEAEEGETP